MALVNDERLVDGAGEVALKLDWVKLADVLGVVSVEVREDDVRAVVVGAVDDGVAEDVVVADDGAVEDGVVDDEVAGD